jgi:hypothetical protein
MISSFHSEYWAYGGALLVIRYSSSSLYSPARLAQLSVSLHVCLWFVVQYDALDALDARLFAR